MWDALTLILGRGPKPEIRIVGKSDPTEVDAYWNEHTVNSRPFRAALQSSRYLVWRSSIYPKFKEYMDTWGDHSGQVVVDFGCGPGDDVVGFALHSNAKRVIGIDLSSRALRLLQDRLSLHKISPDRIELINVKDLDGEIPLDTGSVDYIHSCGVLHHSTDPRPILRELRRILRDGGEARIMVYNAQSVWLHLYTAYQLMVLEGRFPGMSATEAFQRTTDGVDCPIARCYEPEEFAGLCRQAGFDVTYIGGYLSNIELGCLADHYSAALDDKRLAPEHRAFLRELEFDREGLPLYRGAHAGIGGVFHLTLPRTQ